LDGTEHFSSVKHSSTVPFGLNAAADIVVKAWIEAVRIEGKSLLTLQSYAMG